ncbi:MAG: hypothetical protein ACM3ZQ_07835 [Bacillota bacterium]
MGVGEALALGLGTTAIGMLVTFVTLFGLSMILEMMSIISKTPDHQK